MPLGFLLSERKFNDKRICRGQYILDLYGKKQKTAKDWRILYIKINYLIAVEANGEKEKMRLNNMSYMTCVRIKWRHSDRQMCCSILQHRKLREIYRSHEFKHLKSYEFFHMYFTKSSQMKDVLWYVIILFYITL